ncbi:BatA domain-containing protein [Kordiimonas sp.]|uniref:BatA domain-containing protein n=1 Tax=Kordiimonas sp. TaxID=1970157 RepID=UPI003A9465AE
MLGTLGQLALTNSAALAAAGAILIPIVIHLFNRSKGKRVVIGSIRFVLEAQTKRITELKMMHHLLLALRVSILALLALFLAGLYNTSPKTIDGPIYYVTPAWLQAAQESEISQLEQTSEGAHVYLLREDYASLNEAKKQEMEAGQTPSGFQAQLLLHRLTTISHNGEVHVYALKSSNDLAEIQALSQYPVNWHLKPSLEDRSDTLPPIRLLIIKDASIERQLLAISQALKVIQTSRNVIIEPFISDGRNQTAQLPGSLNWIIVSETTDKDIILPLPDASTNLLTLAADNRNGPGYKASLDDYPFTRFTADVNDPTTSQMNTSIWRTDNGLPLMSLASYKGHDVFKLHFPLTGAFDSLANQPDFPQVLLRLLTQKKPDTDLYPSIMINAPQAMTSGSMVELTATHEGKRLVLSRYIAIVIFALWLLERWLVDRVRDD